MAMNLLVKGLILGMIMVMPGMSGGTAFLILGLYEDIVKDIVKLNIKPYIPLIIGIIGGIFASGLTFAFVFENYRNATVAFLLGCLLASTKSVLKDCPKLNPKFFIMLALGTIVGMITVGEPLSFSGGTEDVSLFTILIGGALSSAAMIIPGIPGSSVLILMGIYDVMFVSISELDMVNLLVFGAGAIIGIILLLNILSRLYDKYKALLSYFFAGLILGSARSMIPSNIDLVTVTLFIGAFLMVWFFSDKEGGQPQPDAA